MGMGYTANDEVASKLFKSETFGTPGNFLSPNNQIHPMNMISAGSKYALRVFIENNLEEVDFYEKTKHSSSPNGELNLKPKWRTVSLHNPLVGKHKIKQL